MIINDYTLSCPCLGRVIEGTLIKVHGEAPEINEGAFVECPCACLHRVQLVDHDARLIALTQMTVDEQIETHAKMGRNLAKLGCPICDRQHTVEIAEGLDPTDGSTFACPACEGLFTITERRGHELITRALSGEEVAEFEASVARSVFGGWTSGAGTAFGRDPFRPFGGAR